MAEYDTILTLSRLLYYVNHTIQTIQNLLPPLFTPPLPLLFTRIAVTANTAVVAISAVIAIADIPVENGQIIFSSLFL
jgi:hypothetical protein